jgi:hypothetical protein
LAIKTEFGAVTKDPLLGDPERSTKLWRPLGLICPIMSSLFQMAAHVIHGIAP